MKASTMARLLLTALSAAALLSCSAIGLTDDLAPAKCVGEASDFCEDLNDTYPTGDDCLRWGCDPVSELCAILPADFDGDGHPTPGCGEPGDVEDCDDDDPTRFPGNTESCDGVDNDCDGIIDEGAFTLQTTPLGAFGHSTDVAQVSYTLGAEGGQVLAVSETGTSTNVPAGGTFAASLDGVGVVTSLELTSGASPVEVTSGTIAAASLTEGHVVAFTTASHGCGGERVVVGQLNMGTDSLGLQFPAGADEDHFDNGLPDENGDPCAAGFEAANLAMAAVDDEVVIAYVKVDPDTRTFCTDGAGDLPDAAPLLLNYVRRQRDGDLARDEMLQAVVLTQSADNAPPALLGVSSRLWLIAAAGESGDIVFYALRRVDDGGSRTIEPSELLTVAAPAGAPQGEVALTAGSVDGDGVLTVGLAFRRGCRGAAEVFVGLYAFDGEADSLTELAAPVAVDAGGSAADQRRPTLAYWPDGDEWLVAYQRGFHEILARRIDAAGVPIDDPLDPLLTVPESDPRPSFSQPAFSFPLFGDVPGYGLVAYVPGETDHGFWGVRLTCAAD